MPSLREAIQEFQQSQLAVYRADPTRIQRDANTARRAAKDYAGRWFFELLQNCEDAKASTVGVRVTDDAAYVADNGSGLLPEAVAAISGTDFSDKSVGMIGRKGVGFKAVYELTEAPQIFSGEDAGLEFSPKRAEDWARERGLPVNIEMPYQWLPFFISRAQEERTDPVLREFHDFSTAIRLPFRSDKVRDLACSHVADWPPYALLPFRHVSSLRVDAPALSFRTEVVRQEGASLLLRDSRDENQTEWKVLRRSASPPDECSADLDFSDRERVREVEFLIAAPVDADGTVEPTDGSLPVHVFYPTEERSPVRLLLHGEFLVKTDRTSVIPLRESRFNSWVADELAALLVEFVNDSYDPRAPAANLRLLVPTKASEDLTLGKELWDRLLRKASGMLSLPDTRGGRGLTLAQARMLSVTVGTEQARWLVERAQGGWDLLHEAVDADNEAREALRGLGCQRVSDQDLLEVIKESAPQSTDDRAWLWASCSWLAAWLAERQWGDERQKRKERIMELPVLPASAALLSPGSLRDKIVTWRSSDLAPDIPGWLPLVLVEDWFRDRVAPLEKVNPVRRLLAELGVEEPGANVLLKALKRGIKGFWHSPDEDPARFLRFLVSQDWSGTDDLSSLGGCPVPARVTGESGFQWVHATDAYLGEEWGETRVERLYSGTPGVAWVVPIGDSHHGQERAILECLGVVPYPRVVPKSSLRREEATRAESALPYHTALGEIDPPLVLDRIDPEQLEAEAAAHLLVLLSHYWDRYYRGHATVSVPYKYYTWYRHALPSLWWHHVLHALVPPLEENLAAREALGKCWLPNREARRAIGNLIPIVALASFGEDDEAVRKWLSEQVRVRKALVELPLGEWREMLSQRVPSLFPAEEIANNPKRRDNVVRWYEACLDSLDEQQDVQWGALSSISLLSQKGEEWGYRPCGCVWLADDDEVARAFRSDCWQIELRTSLHSQAKRFFGLRAISEATRLEFRAGDALLEEGRQGELQRALDEVCPYVFAWRCSHTREDPEKVRSDLGSLSVHVVDGLCAHLKLAGRGMDGEVERKVDRPYGLQDRRDILISARNWDSRFTSLARALAEAVGTRTEADLYENLLRCRTAAEREGKLLSKGTTKGELDRLLRSFDAESEAGHRAAESGGGMAEPATTLAESVGCANGGPAEARSPTPTCGDHQTATKGRDEETQKSSEERETPLLKDPRTAEIDSPFVSPQGAGGRGGEQQRWRRDESQTDRRRPSQEEKGEIEECGRMAVERNLVEMGYSVTQMPQSNPGFDIRATRQGVELRVEVKAHTGSASIVDVTKREIEECSRQEAREGIRWELWNVENLSAAVPSPIRITRYDHIPDDALSERILALDLRKCTPVHP